MSAFKRNALTFGITFCISLLIFILISIPVMSLISPSGKDNDEATTDTTKTTSSDPSSQGQLVSPTAGFTVMLMGNDFSSGSSSSNADAIMFVRFTEDAVVYLPIPGNTVTYDNGVKTTLAEFYNSTGSGSNRDPQLLADKVTALTGISVDYYISTSLDGFEDVVDTLGGVTFFVPRNMEYEDESIGYKVDLKTGDGKDEPLTGSQAVDMLRYLGDFDDSNYEDRLEIIGDFMKSFIEECIGEFSDPDKASSKFEDMQIQSMFKTNMTEPVKNSSGQLESYKVKREVNTLLPLIFNYDELDIVNLKCKGSFEKNDEGKMIFEMTAEDQAALRNDLAEYKNY